MKELENVAIPPLGVFLVGRSTEQPIAFPSVPTENAADTCLAELSGLVKNLDMVICGKTILRRTVLSARFGIGPGQAADIMQNAADAGAECIVFDFDISPTQLRNWERESNLQIYDRQGIIILIFASRARTKEAVLQVELAKLEYALPRLAHTYHSLSRQRGGSYGSKGAGESKLELDRREIQDKIAEVKKALAVVRKNRSVQRQRRLKTPVPTAALVGYTNAGKSSLLNILTASNVLTKDALFATLDPSTRKLEIGHGMAVLISDTVGFIRNLPHSLVEAFHATLEEALLSDVLIIVLDASDPEIKTQYDTTISVLREIGADDKPAVIVLNKTDLLPENFAKISPVGDNIIAYPSEESLSALFPDAVPVSAVSGSGLQELCARLYEILPGHSGVYDIPLPESALISLLYQESCVESAEWTDISVRLVAKVPPRLAKRFEPFLQQTSTQE